MKKILIPIANGCEEIETSTIFSILSRAGNKVHLASIHNQLSQSITLSRGIQIKANAILNSICHTDYAMLVLPGGVKGAENFNCCHALKSILKERKVNKLHYAAICATPGLFLAPNHLLLNKATCYPTFKSNIISAGYQYINKGVVIDNHIITGRGAGDAIEFSLKLVEVLNGISKANEVKKGLLL